MQLLLNLTGVDNFQGLLMGTEGTIGESLRRTKFINCVIIVKGKGILLTNVSN